MFTEQINVARPVYLFAGYFHTPKFSLLCIPHLKQHPPVPLIIIINTQTPSLAPSSRSHCIQFNMFSRFSLLNRWFLLLLQFRIIPLGFYHHSVFAMASHCPRKKVHIPSHGSGDPVQCGPCLSLPLQVLLLPTSTFHSVR